MWTDEEYERRKYLIDVHLYDRKTQAANVYRTVAVPTEEGDEFNDFIWSEGNFACDHNRVCFLYGHDSPEADDTESFNCTSERIVVDKVVRVSDGKVLYGESR